MRFRIEARVRGERLAPRVVDAAHVAVALDGAVAASDYLTDALQLMDVEERVVGAHYAIRFVSHTTWVAAVVEPPAERRCAYCRHWDAGSVGLHGDRPGLADLHVMGVCRRYPPRMAAPLPEPVRPPPPGATTAPGAEPAAPEGPPPQREPTWPTMPPEGWCGEWSDAETPPAP